MRRLLLFTGCVLAMSRILAAQQRVMQLPRIEPSPASLDRLATQSTALTQGVISGDCDGALEVIGEYLYPIVAHVQGLNGTFYRSDLTIANFRDTPQDYLLQFLPAGVPGLGQPVRRFMITANTIVSITDILGPQGFNVNGVGSILATAVLPHVNTIDTMAELETNARIYTPQPNLPLGTNGFSYKASHLKMLPAATTVATLYGLLQSADFRTNATLVNLDDISHTWTVTAIGSGVSQLQWQETVPALSMLQFAVPPTFMPGGSNYFAMTAVPVPSISLNYAWTFSAVSADNHTGDTFSGGAKIRF